LLVVIWCSITSISIFIAIEPFFRLLLAGIFTRYGPYLFLFRFYFFQFRNFTGTCPRLSFLLRLLFSPLLILLIESRQRVLSYYILIIVRDGFLNFFYRFLVNF